MLLIGGKGGWVIYGRFIVSYASEFVRTMFVRVLFFCSFLLVIVISK